nr:MAG TPA: hypothetical protein [Caudoviricetes sp.]
MIIFQIRIHCKAGFRPDFLRRGSSDCIFGCQPSKPHAYETSIHLNVHPASKLLFRLILKPLSHAIIYHHAALMLHPDLECFFARA